METVVYCIKWEFIYRSINLWEFFRSPRLEKLAQSWKEKTNSVGHVMYESSVEVGNKSHQRSFMSMNPFSIQWVWFTIIIDRGDTLFSEQQKFRRQKFRQQKFRREKEYNQILWNSLNICTKRWDHKKIVITGKSCWSEWVGKECNRKLCKARADLTLWSRNKPTN